MVDILKAGWLYRQSSILKRWKKSWYSLSINGILREFDSPDKFIANKTLDIPNEVIAIDNGVQVNTPSPFGLSPEHLIKLITRDDAWILCAENIDEMIIWKISFEEMKSIRQPSRIQNVPQSQSPVLIDNPNGFYPVHYQDNYQGNSQIAFTPQGPVTVVYVPQPNYYHGFGHRPRYYRGFGYRPRYF